MLHRYYPNACLIKEIVFTLFIIFQNYRTEFYIFHYLKPFAVFLFLRCIKSLVIAALCC
ncbi:hypothetical protein [Klebsiella pneumoniae]|uniref:hypothetical protein n=1 Tax=Klebsiella pneumoniae TaxID=573 RepID=UPI003D2FED7A